jgi:hypothetical protein
MPSILIILEIQWQDMIQVTSLLIVEFILMNILQWLRTISFRTTGLRTC